MVGRLKKPVVHLLYIFFLCTFAAGAWGAEPEQLNQSIDNALSWMEQRLCVDADDWGVNLAADIRDLSEVVPCLKEKRPDAEVTGQAIAWLRQQELVNDDFAARILPFLEDPQTYTEVRDSLFASQQTDGGWGLTAAYHSDVLDTVLVISALLHDSQPDTDILIRGISYLLQTQQADGSWAYVEGQPGSVFLTSECVLLLNDFMLKTNLGSEELDTCMSQAGAYLVAQQGSDQTWGTDEDTLPATLLAYRAVLTTVGSASATNFEDTLLSLQSADGSWQENSYTTLLAIQALSDKPSASNISITDIKLFKFIGEEKIESLNFGPYENIIIEPVTQYDNTIHELQVLIKYPDNTVESACQEDQYGWNTTFSPAGTYKAIAILKDKQNGRVLASQEKEFTIDSAFAIKDLILSTYPGTTRVGQAVQTSINISLLNQSNQDGEAEVETTVIAPDGTILFSSVNVYACAAQDELINLD